MIVTGRILLGVMVGASFGVAVGALVASWVYGVAAIEEQKVNASYLAGAVTVFGALIGGLIGYRTTRHRPDSADQA
jgi:MFS family permease